MLKKVDDRIPILHLARTSSTKQKETETWIEKDGFRLGLRLLRKTVETFHVSSPPFASMQQRSEQETQKSCISESSVVSALKIL